MNIKNAIAYFKNRKNKKDDFDLEQVYTDCPEVIIDDKILTITLGQWMGKLPDSIKTSGNGMAIISHLDADELLAKKMISKSDLEIIKKRFANILKMAGFGKGNTCVLNSFNEDTLTFKCDFYDTDQIADMRIRFGSWFDNGPELYVDFDGINTVYEFWSANKEHPDRLDVQSVTKEIDGRGKKFRHFNSEFSYYGDVYDEENKLSVVIEYPKSLASKQSDNPYVDKEKIEELLSTITFPADLEDICSKVASALLVDSKEFEKISIIVRKMKGHKELNITNQAEFNKDFLVKLIITKNGKTVMLSNFEEWSYNTENYVISQTNDKNVSYGFKSMPVDELDVMPTPQEMISTASKEVENVRVLAKTLLQKNKTTE